MDQLVSKNGPVKLQSESVISDQIIKLTCIPEHIYYNMVKWYMDCTYTQDFERAGNGRGNCQSLFNLANQRPLSILCQSKNNFNSNSCPSPTFHLANNLSHWRRAWGHVWSMPTLYLKREATHLPYATSLESPLNMTSCLTNQIDNMTSDPAPDREKVEEISEVSTVRGQI